MGWVRTVREQHLVREECRSAGVPEDTQDGTQRPCRRRRAPARGRPTRRGKPGTAVAQDGSTTPPAAMPPYRHGHREVDAAAAVWRPALPLGERGGVGSPRVRRSRGDEGGNLLLLLLKVKRRVLDVVVP